MAGRRTAVTGRGHRTRPGWGRRRLGAVVDAPCPHPDPESGVSALPEDLAKELPCGR
ncbi:hypothetical protein LI90_137 [Carbonactinospora thermoautotrophica]|uniref:Uncharacterized protein n=1 Tax=Carbonactinospora thermoautotrophica TaxID=1469144 RepID=A0A132ML92_9ACTN|nr:hypothetical protein LI90_137 [Carbonactinospora thermoautotrophica]